MFYLIIYLVHTEYIVIEFTEVDNFKIQLQNSGLESLERKALCKELQRGIHTFKTRG